MKRSNSIQEESMLKAELQKGKTALRSKSSKGSGIDLHFTGSSNIPDDRIKSVKLFETEIIDDH